MESTTYRAARRRWRARRTAAVGSSAEKNDSMTSSETVMSSGVPNAATVVKNASVRSRVVFQLPVQGLQRGIGHHVELAAQPVQQAASRAQGARRSPRSHYAAAEASAPSLATPVSIRAFHGWPQLSRRQLR
jgi:hypothetical protein